MFKQDMLNSMTMRQNIDNKKTGAGCKSQHPFLLDVVDRAN